MDTTVMQEATLAVLTLVIGLLGYAARSLITVGVEYLKVKIGVTGLTSLKEYAALAVRFLEQSPVFKEWDGAEKKERAIVMITKWAEDNKLPFDHEFVDHAVEEAVQMMNSELIKVDFSQEAK